MSDIEIQLPLPNMKRPRGRPVGSKTRPMQQRLEMARARAEAKGNWYQRPRATRRPILRIDDQIKDAIAARIPSIRALALNRGIPFDVTVDDLYDCYRNQSGRCKLSGIEMIITHASLDRIDSSKGYIAGNVQWLVPFINKMKNDASQDEFLEVIRLIYDHSIGPKIAE